MVQIGTPLSKHLLIQILIKHESNTKSGGSKRKQIQVLLMCICTKNIFDMQKIYISLVWCTNIQRKEISSEIIHFKLTKIKSV